MAYLPTFTSTNGPVFFGKLKTPTWNEKGHKESLNQAMGHRFFKYGHIPSGKLSHSELENHNFSWVNPLFSMAIFNSYVKLPEGNHNQP